MKMKRLSLLAIAMIICSVSMYAESETNRVSNENEGVTLDKVVNTLKERLKFTGYAQFGYTYDDAQDADNEFDIKRIILIMEGKVTDRWTLGFMYNFNSGGSLQEVFADYKVLPGLNARMGQFKVPYTIESPISLTLVEMINGYSQATNYLAGIGPQDTLYGANGGRDLGLSIYGKLFNDVLTYNLGVFNGQGINTKDKNSNKDIVGSVLVSPLNWLSVGGSFIKGKGHAIATSVYNPEIQVGDNYQRDRWAGGLVIKTAPVNIRAEYLGGKDGNVKSEGYYANFEIHACRKLDFIVSYDYLNKNKSMSAKQTNYVAGLQYWFYPKCRLQAQYTFSDKKLGDNSNMIQTQIQIAF